MDTDKPTAGVFSPRLVFGLAVMVLGLMLTLDNLGFVEARRFIRLWPVVLIAAGLARLRQSLRTGGGREGLLVTLLGVALLLVNLSVLRFRQVLPLFLLGLGASIVWKALRRRGGERPLTDGSDRIDAFALMGGVRRGASAPDFRGGSASAVMGGCEIDLSRASIESGEAVIDTFALWGGVDIQVPEDWVVETRGIALLGSFEDKTRRPADGKKKLVITGLALMGGVEVKN